MHVHQVLNKIYQNGYVCILNWRCWAGTTTIRPEEYGVDDLTAAKMPRAVRSGAYFLLPKHFVDHIARLRTRSYRVLEKLSTKFPLIPEARYLTHKQREQVDTDLKAIQEELQETTQRIQKQWHTIQEEQIDLIRQTWGQVLNGHQDILEGIISRVQSKYPRLEDVPHQFSFTWHYYEMRIPGTEDVDKYAHTLKDAVAEMVQDSTSSLKKTMQAIQRTINQGRRVSKTQLEALANALDRARMLYPLLNDETQQKIETVLQHARQMAEAASAIGSAANSINAIVEWHTQFDKLNDHMVNNILDVQMNNEDVTVESRPAMAPIMDTSIGE